MDSITIDTLRMIAGVLAICFSVLTGALVVAGATRASSLDGFRFLAGLGLASSEAKTEIDTDADMRILTLRGLILTHVKWGMSVIFTSFAIMVLVDESLSSMIRLVVLIMLAAHAFLVLFEMYWGLSEIAYPPKAKGRGK